MQTVTKKIRTWLTVLMTLGHILRVQGMVELVRWTAQQLLWVVSNQFCYSRVRKNKHLKLLSPDSTSQVSVLVPKLKELKLQCEKSWTSKVIRICREFPSMFLNISMFKIGCLLLLPLKKNISTVVMCCKFSQAYCTASLTEAHNRETITSKVLKLSTTYRNSHYIIQK